jgi:predicted Zn-dependent protease
MAVLAVMALGVLFGSQYFQDQADCKKALQLAEQHKFAEAQPLLLRLQERYPNKVEVVRALALGYLRTEQWDKAEKFLNRWCELQPQEIEAYKQRHGLWINQHEVALAIRDLQHILRLNPHDYSARRSLVSFLMAESRFDEAEEEARRCLQAQPGDGSVTLLLAHIYRAQKRTDLATDLTDQVLRAAPDSSDGIKLRAQLYLDAGQLEPAIALLRKLVAATDGKGLYELSQALARAGREDEAKKALAELECRQALSNWKSLPLHHDNVALQERVVQALLAVGKTDEAIRFLSDILMRLPQAPSGTHLLLADCYDKQGHPGLAAQERRRAGLRP